MELITKLQTSTLSSNLTSLSSNIELGNLNE